MLWPFSPGKVRGSPAHLWAILLKSIAFVEQFHNAKINTAYVFVCKSYCLFFCVFFNIECNHGKHVSLSLWAFLIASVANFSGTYSILMSFFIFNIYINIITIISEKESRRFEEELSTKVRLRIYKRYGSNRSIINPWHACAARVIVVVLCVYVCVYVSPLISAALHIGITQQRYQRVHSNTAIV